MFHVIRKKINLMPKRLLFHSQRVALLGYILSRQIDLRMEESKHIIAGGLLHDIGKCVISPGLLYKKGKLSEDEFNEIKMHCIYGVNIISKNDNISFLLPIIQYHHERWDGLGYFGLKNSEIPLNARIISIADAFDAMTSHRPYQAKRTVKDAMSEINKCSGTQFDPYLVDNFNIVYNDFIRFIAL